MQGALRLPGVPVVTVHRSSTWFEGWSRAQSLAVLLLLGLIIGLSSLMSEPPPAPVPIEDVSFSDVDLYRSVVTAISEGHNYYDFIVQAHRGHGYPLKPFVTVRPPLLAVFSGTIGPLATRLTLTALIVATTLAWYARLRTSPLPLPATFGAAVLIAMAGALLYGGSRNVFHESWAGLLIALSLALRTPQHYRAAVFFGLLAVLIREFTIAYLGMMLVCAAYERRWHEAMLWLGTLLLGGMAMAGHAFILSHYVLPGDLSSQGWSGFGGWRFYLHAVRETTLLIFPPRGLGQALLPLCLFGWLSLSSGTAFRVFGLLIGYGLMVMLFARPVNFYWSLLEAPLLPAGLVFSFFGLSQLLHNVVRPSSEATAASVTTD